MPTGNFGNVLAGWIARQMGAPIDHFIVASNANDILTRFVNDSDMSTAPVVPTLSPSMDIQVSSNFERLLFEMNGRDGGLTAEQLQRFRASGRLSIEPDQRAEFIDGTFRAARLDDAETLAVIARIYASTGMLVDPHTAVGVGAVERAAAGSSGRTGRHAGDGPPGEVPRRRRAGHRRAPAAAGAPRRPVRAPRALHRAAQRPGGGASIRRTRCPSADLARRRSDVA